MEELKVILPEIILLVFTCLTLVVDLFTPKKAKVLTYLSAQVALGLTMVACFYFPDGARISVFNNQFIADPFAQGMKVFILGIVFLVFLYSRNYVKDREIPYGEFHLLGLFSTLGMMFLVSAKSLLMIYLGLELLTLPLYALVAMQKEAKLAVEASMKYFILGALASGMLLYGMSLLYGVSGSIQLAEIATFIKVADAGVLQVSLFALIFILGGLVFKLGAVPFHMWIPDVYEGAPTHVTLFISTAPKVAAFGMAYRLLHDTFTSFAGYWSSFFVVLAILSLAIGNITAIAQTNVKRLLAYSAISHIGFLLLGLLVAPIIGYAPSLYYILIYALMTLVAFGILIRLSQHGIEAQTFDDLKGLSQRCPWLAFLMLLTAFSLAGVPPTAGFYAKFMILSALVDANMVWLAGVSIIFSVIGAYYYLKLVRVMYFDAPKETLPLTGALDFRMALSLNGLAILALGMFPAPLFVICQNMLMR